MSASARRTLFTPSAAATAAVSTWWSPLARTMTGCSSAVNTSDLTIAPTGTPSAAAAWSAVRVESASSRISPDAPPSRKATATRSTLGCTPRTLVRDVDDDAGRVVEGQHAEPVLGADAEADADDAFEVADERDLAQLRVVNGEPTRTGI